MDPDSFVRSIGIGLAIAAPIGPMGLLCIRRTLAEGRAAGLATGLGVATVHTLYGGLSGLGFTAVAALLAEHRPWLRLLGAAVLWCLGLRVILARPAMIASDGGHSLLRAYASAVALALANPLTLLSFAAFVAASGATDFGTRYATVAPFALGIGLGSTAWWCALSGVVSLARARLSPRTIGRLNRLSGGGIAAFGLLLLLTPSG